ncbi:hypothetical protein [Mycobacterium sp. IDR2000157661]|uniref:hypothetical protein n=1 Tax=Mycobacterium sp. IDR2000157661 TaxID=2867005 RepID=UPI001EE9B863|nr:hypothetical protein [Mycobacterium sp. IDR2000157661]ULE32874.1 hypothetical protein K3G64_22845 [Mycobacterium sp. IDR2000157661]
MTTWGEGTTRGNRKARTDTLEHDNYECQSRLPGCTRQAATAITVNGQLQSACPHCIDSPPPAAPKAKRTARKKAAGQTTSRTAT